MPFYVNKNKMFNPLFLLSTLIFIYSLGVITNFNWIPKTHDHELYHYIIGGKYFDEIGYEGLYDASALALSEEERFDPTVTAIRDLKNKEYYKTVGEALSDGKKHKQNMGEKKWERFKFDIMFFDDKYKNTDLGWETGFNDHGFNPSPVWCIYGNLLISAFNLADIYEYLPLVDLFILVACSFLLTTLLPGSTRWLFFSLFWFFMAFFPGEALSIKHWIIGSYLRFTWFLWLCLGLACLSRSRFFLAALFLTTATLERVFPGAFLGAAGLWLLFQVVGWYRGEKKWRISNLLHYSLGILCAFFLWIGLSMTLYSSNAIYDSIDHITKHSQIYAENQIGYKMILIYSDEQNRSRRWSVDGEKSERINSLGGKYLNIASGNRAKSNYPQLIMLVFVCVLALVLIPQRFSLCVSTILLGLVVIFFLSTPTHYYYIFLICLIWSVFHSLEDKSLSSPVLMLVYILALCLGYVGLTQFGPDLTVLRQSVVSSHLLFVLIVLLFSTASNNVYLQLLVGGLALGFSYLTYFNNTLKGDANIPPVKSAEVLSNISGESMSASGLRTLRANYFDLEGRKLSEGGVILRPGQSINIPVNLVEIPDGPLNLIVRTDFNYKTKTFLSVNQKYRHEDSSPRVGSVFVYLTIPIDASWLNQGVNELVFGLESGRAMAVYHMWLTQDL